jgi:hypothetical protein
MEHSDHKNDIKNANSETVKTHTKLLLEFIDVIQMKIDKVKVFCEET